MKGSDIVTSEVMNQCSTESRGVVAASLFSPDFRALSLQDRAILEPILRANPQPLAGFTFAGLFGWADVFAYEWQTLPSGALLISCIFEPGGRRELVQPIGNMSPEEQHDLVARATDLDYAVRLHGVSEPFFESHPVIAAACTAEADRARFDYVYNAMDLAFLKGRSYVRKRNHVAQAEHAHRWTAEPLSATNIAVFRQVAAAALQDLDEDNVTFKQENRALSRTLDHAIELGQDGLLLFADGAPAAFSIFEAQGPGLAVIHFERAVRAYKGAFQMINRATAQAIHSQGFARINREEDLGLEGLRKAKLSYAPIELAKSYVLTFKR
jgi:uncharacterized protein